MQNSEIKFIVFEDDAFDFDLIPDASNEATGVEDAPGGTPPGLPGSGGTGLPTIPGMDDPGVPGTGNAPEDDWPGHDGPGLPSLPGNGGSPPSGSGILDGTGPADAEPDLLVGFKTVAAGGTTGGKGAPGGKGTTPPAKGSYQNPYQPHEKHLQDKYGGWAETDTSMIWIDPILALERTNNPSKSYPGMRVNTDPNAAQGIKAHAFLFADESWEFFWDSLEEDIGKVLDAKAKKDHAAAQKKQQDYADDVTKDMPTEADDEKDAKDWLKKKVEQTEEGTELTRDPVHPEENDKDKKDGDKKDGDKGQGSTPGDTSGEAGTTTNPDDDTPPPVSEEEAKEIIKKATGIPDHVITWVDGIDFYDIKVPEDPQDFIDAVNGDAPMDPDAKPEPTDPSYALPTPAELGDPWINPGNPQDEFA